MADLLRQIRAAVAARNQQQVTATADALVAAWPDASRQQTARSPQMGPVPQHMGMPWLPIGGGAAGLLLALVVTTGLHVWRKQERPPASGA